MDDSFFAFTDIFLFLQFHFHPHADLRGCKACAHRCLDGKRGAVAGIERFCVLCLQFIERSMEIRIGVEQVHAAEYAENFGYACDLLCLP